MCVLNLRSLRDIPANIGKPLAAASRGFDIVEFFPKIFGPLTFKTVLPAMEIMHKIDGICCILHKIISRPATDIFKYVIILKN